MKRNGLWLVGLLGALGCDQVGFLSDGSNPGDAAPVRPGVSADDDAIAVDSATLASPTLSGIVQTGDKVRLRDEPAVFADGAPESCGNLADDDADGLIDCQDPDCAASCSAGAGAIGAACAAADECAAAAGNAPACLDEAGFGFPGGYCTQLCDLATPSSCGGDGLCLDVGLGATGVCFDGCNVDADCSRGVCVDAHAIDPAQPAGATLCYPFEKNCNDGTDDDGDGFVDCADYDCDGTPACVAQTCAAGETYPANFPLDGVAGSSFDTYALAGSCVGANGYEQIFAFSPTVTATFTVHLDSATDQGVYVIDGCGGAAVELGCANQVGGGQTETLVFSAIGGTTYYVVVDADAPAANGSFLLTFSEGS